MGFDINIGVPALTVFLQGILSFFSPCVLPLVPLYVSYLAGGTRSVDESGAVRYRRKTVFLNTLFFVLGISFTFFLLGLGFTAVGRFFSGNQRLFATIGGVIVILFGLLQLGVFQSKALSQEQRLPLNLGKLAMNPLTALLLGFTFSFAWTQCVGPALASVLIMASSASSAGAGFLLIGVYTLGFVIPFLAVGLFTGTVLDFFRKHRKVVAYTAKIGGVLMILMGVMMITGWMNSLTGYLSSFGGAAGGGTAVSSSAETSSEENNPTGSATESDVQTDESQAENAASDTASETGNAADSSDNTDSSSDSEESSAIPVPDVDVVDQYGVTHNLRDYEGKVIFLNFWTTWCGYCKQEMPDIEALYQEYGLNENELVILGVANPASDKASSSADNEDAAGIASFLEENGYTYPVLMDETGELFRYFYINSFPTTFLIDKNGDILGYIPGAVSKSVMQDVIQQTLEVS